MVIDKVLGNLKDFNVEGKNVDTVNVDWFDINKKIMRKTSKMGKKIGMRFEKSENLKDGDIIYSDENDVVAVSIPESEAIVIKPETMEDMGKICYEIGNKHIPLFLKDNEVIVNYDEPLFKVLEKKGFNPCKTVRRLTGALEHSPHQHGSHDHHEIHDHSGSHGHNHDHGHSHGHHHEHE